MGNQIPLFTVVHCSVEEVFKCLRSVVRCLERVRVPYIFTAFHDLHITDEDMIINTSRSNPVANFNENLWERQQSLRVAHLVPRGRKTALKFP